MRYHCILALHTHPCRLTCSQVLQCHGGAEEALAAASATIKGLLALPAQAAQVSLANGDKKGACHAVGGTELSLHLLQDIVSVQPVVSATNHPIAQLATAGHGSMYAVAVKQKTLQKSVAWSAVLGPGSGPI